MATFEIPEDPDEPDIPLDEDQKARSKKIWQRLMNLECQQQESYNLTSDAIFWILQGMGEEPNDQEAFCTEESWLLAVESRKRQASHSGKR